MKLKPMPRFRRTMLGLAIVFGRFAVAKFMSHDLYTGLWSFAVCSALVLGLLPPWLTEHSVVDETVKPEKYSLFGE
jgi:hypothetical protein